MVLSWLVCCAVREDEATTTRPAVIPVMCYNPRGRKLHEDPMMFFDCAETEAELAALKSWRPLTDCHATKAAESDQSEGGRPDCCSALAPLGCAELAAAAAVLEHTREQWSQRVIDLRKSGPELEWATLSTARRMLRANIGDAQKAVAMFLQALEFRKRDRTLFQTMRCEAWSDIRVFGRDSEAHPVVYMCAGSQTAPLRSIRDQFVVTFEAACKLTSEDGTVVFVVDMHGLKPHLNMDFSAIKDLADTLGTVYAERIFRIIIVDFSRAAQAVWWMLKPLLSPATRRKFAFVNEKQARELCQTDFDPANYERICSTFRINRDSNCTMEERALHARRTTLCDVPLGPPLR